MVWVVPVAAVGDGLGDGLGDRLGDGDGADLGLGDGAGLGLDGVVVRVGDGAAAGLAAVVAVDLAVVGADGEATRAAGEGLAEPAGGTGLGDAGRGLGPRVASVVTGAARCALDPPQEAVRSSTAVRLSVCHSPRMRAEWTRTHRPAMGRWS
jgi:hypothetical protein